MKTFFERILVGFAIGLFSGIISIVIVPSLIGLVFYGDALGGLWFGAYLFAFFGWPIGMSIGIVIGVFIGMTDYTDNVKYKWGIVAGLGATGLAQYFLGICQLCWLLWLRSPPPSLEKLLLAA